MSLFGICYLVTKGPQYMSIGICAQSICSSSARARSVLDLYAQGRGLPTYVKISSQAQKRTKLELLKAAPRLKPEWPPKMAQAKASLKVSQGRSNAHRSQPLFSSNLCLSQPSLAGVRERFTSRLHAHQPRASQHHLNRILHVNAPWLYFS